ncbi:MAG: sigma-70 family RNA polymerase sigma factor [Bacteroidetes bacterium]|nr:sigma-70 family RNA polymerase sigma factor [Bacteroidota bacterium]
MDNFDLHIHAPLIEECRKGSSRAQFLLYNQYSKAMYNIAYRMLNNREDAEDMLQETFVDCFRNLNSFRFESTFGAWLKRILINKCINHLQKKKIDLMLTDELPNKAYEEEDETVYDISGIIKGIEMLPDGYRVILTLYLLEGYDHSEIAQILGITESTSKSQYSRAKDKLRSQLSKN